MQFVEIEIHSGFHDGGQQSHRLWDSVLGGFLQGDNSRAPDRKAKKHFSSDTMPYNNASMTPDEINAFWETVFPGEGRGIVEQADGTHAVCRLAFRAMPDQCESH
jgi:hypothetical protein